ncbi:hypothetical protein [Paraburkholderia sp. GAS334]|uniref:hypothetical protein n=1 Tax=Paraburkholderia sp. GAS334 TaxID=3035131 RepID=UPI003D21EDD4
MCGEIGTCLSIAFRFGNITIGQLLPDADLVAGTFRSFGRLENESRIFLLHLVRKDRPDFQREIQKADQKTKHRYSGHRCRTWPERHRESAHEAGAL